MSSAPTTWPDGPWVAVGAALGGVALGAAAILVGRPQPRPTPPQPAPQIAQSTPDPAPAAEPGPAPSRLVQAVARTRDSVVNLTTDGGSLGAGVVVDPKGLVLTNAHVIADVLVDAGVQTDDRTSRSIPGVRATFADGREIPAVVLFSDPDEDLAVLRLQAPGQEFAAATLGRSSELALGEEVFAIGNPFGLGHTVSRGIISALDRVGVLPNRDLAVLQLDAAINVGDSGGPLFDLDGELVGIVTARVGDQPLGRAEGIAFALPIDHIRAFLRAATGEAIARNGIVGLQGNPYAPLPPQVRALGYSHGLLVEGVYRGYPADRAGIQRGDVIVALRGKRLDALAGTDRPTAIMQHIQRSVRALFPGETLPVTVVRGDRVLDLQIEVAAATPQDQARIDAEELLGVMLAASPGTEAGDAPIIGGFLPHAFARRLRARRRLLGARIVEFMGRPIATVEDLGVALAEVRDLGRRSGGVLRIVVGVRTRDGHLHRLVVPIRVGGPRARDQRPRTRRGRRAHSAPG